MRLGVIGAGGIATSSHLPSLAALRRGGWPVSVTAIADPSDAAIAAAMRVAPELMCDCRQFTSGETLLEASKAACDALLVLMPPESTPTLLRAARDCGVGAIFVEKPVAQDAAELAALLAYWQAGSDAPPLLQVGYNRRWQPGGVGFRQRLGEMRATAGVGSDSVNLEAKLWRINRREAIFYRDTMIHAVDFALWCLGPLTIEQVVAGPPVPGSGIPQTLSVKLRSASGPEAVPIAVHLDVQPTASENIETYAGVSPQGAGWALGYASAVDAPPETLGLGVLPAALDRQSKAEAVPVVPLLPHETLLHRRGFLEQMAAFVRASGGQGDGASRVTPDLHDALAARRLTDEILSAVAP